MEKLNVAVIGGGGIAATHLAALVESARAQVVVVVDPDPAARERWKGTGLRVESDYKVVLADRSIHVVDLCLPHHLHEPVATEALAMGKHVITEKPIARSGMEADQMLAAAKLANRRLVVNHTQLFQANHVELKRRLEAGEVGRPFLGVVSIIGDEFARMNDPGSWKGDVNLAGGGIMIDTGVHAVYLLEYLLGPARAVTACGRRLRVHPHHKGEDNAVVALEFDEALGSITATYTATGHPWYERREIHGPKGALYATEEGAESVLTLVRGRDIQELLRVPSLFRESFRLSLDNALAAIQGEAEPVVTDDAVRHTMATMDAIYRSMQSGRRMEVEE